VVSFNRFHGRVAFVTGAGQGIGKGCAMRLAEEGANVVVVDVNPETAKQTAWEIKALGVDALECPMDVTDLSQVSTGVAQGVARFGQIDVLVNCAGVAQQIRWHDIQPADWDFIMNINARGLFFVSQSVANHMVQRRSGRIVNMASAAGKGGSARNVVYSASKAGVLSLTRSMAAALAPYNVTVNALCPGYVVTPMSERSSRESVKFGMAPGEYHQYHLSRIPLGRTTTPEEVAGLVAFLASDEAAYMTGQSVNVTGGGLFD
jgi:meso-butanediol dehydrogenase / (S,S)-butanediol dehydrogenase / diacetyl reductase